MSKSEPTGGWLSRPFEEQDFPAASPGWVQGYSNGGTCSPRGQKWGQVVESAATDLQGKVSSHRPLLTGGRKKRRYPADSFMHRKPKNGARPVIISKISSLKLSPGRLWRLGGFQRLDTSSVFWPRASPGAAFAVPVFCARKSKDATQINSYQEKLLSGLKEKKTHHVGARRQKWQESREATKWGLYGDWGIWKLELWNRIKEKGWGGEENPRSSDSLAAPMWRCHVRSDLNEEGSDFETIWQTTIAYRSWQSAGRWGSSASSPSQCGRACEGQLNFFLN